MNGKTNNSAFGRALSVVMERGRKISILDAQAETDGLPYAENFRGGDRQYVESMNKEASERLDRLSHVLGIYSDCLKGSRDCEIFPHVEYDYESLYEKSEGIVSATKFIASAFSDYEDHMKCVVARSRFDDTIYALLRLASIQIPGTKYCFTDERIAPCCNRALRFEEYLIEKFQKGNTLADLDFQPWRLEDIYTLIEVSRMCLYV